MPSLLKIKIERARDLPVMDRNLQGDASTDAYVVIVLDSQSQRTRTCRKSLNPSFNEEFRFEIVDDSTLQNVPLELKVMDQDLYSSELIGMYACVCICIDIYIPVYTFIFVCMYR